MSLQSGIHFNALVIASSTYVLGGERSECLFLKMRPAQNALTVSIMAKNRHDTIEGRFLSEAASIAPRSKRKASPPMGIRAAARAKYHLCGVIVPTMTPVAIVKTEYSTNKLPISLPLNHAAKQAKDMPPIPIKPASEANTIRVVICSMFAYAMETKGVMACA
jgi:hypothetical protein